MKKKILLELKMNQMRNVGEVTGGQRSMWYVRGGKTVFGKLFTRIIKKIILNNEKYELKIFVCNINQNIEIKLLKWSFFGSKIWTKRIKKIGKLVENCSEKIFKIKLRVWAHHLEPHSACYLEK